MTTKLAILGDLPILIDLTHLFICVNHTTAEAIISITGAATQIDMTIHWTPKFTRSANGYRSRARCFGVSAVETASFQKNRIYKGKSVKMPPSNSGAALRNIPVASATTTLFATIETKH
jgi:hypothetical protein